MGTLIDHEIKRRCIPNSEHDGDFRALLHPFSPFKHAGPPSWGLSSCGYDVRLGPNFLDFFGPSNTEPLHPTSIDHWDVTSNKGVTSWIMDPSSFILGETVETFNMPADVYATVHDKSSWIRLGLAVHNTVIEPGWCGKLTLELKNLNPRRSITIRPGEGIAQVIFHKISVPDAVYEGQYQDATGVDIPHG